MKSIISRLKASVIAITILGNTAYGMGRPATIFEKPTEIGIWDHGDEFYLRMDLSEIDGLTEQRFVWAGFHAVGAELFRGEVVVDDFSPNERRYQAHARLLYSSKEQDARYFLIEVFSPSGERIKEFFLKGPWAPQPEVVDR